MLLITGGAYQGKLKYAIEKSGLKESDIADGTTCSEHEILEKPMVNHFHVIIKRLLEEGKDTEELINQILKLNPNIIIIGDELGCGIVPIEEFDRNYREITGRIYCKLAEHSSEVHRVICGIGMVIKHA